mgnify:CR=1 FL=1
MTRRDPRNRGRLLLRLLVLLLVLAAVGVSVRTGQRPELSLEAELPGIGRSTPVAVTATAPGRGLATLKVSLQQAGRSHSLVDNIYEVPLHLSSEGIDEIIMKLLDLPYRKKDLSNWKALVRKIHQPQDHEQGQRHDEGTGDEHPRQEQPLLAPVVL